MKFFGYTLSQVRKAIAGGVVAAAPLLSADLVDLTHGTFTQAEAGGLLAAFLSGAVVVFFVPNKPPTTTPQDTNTDAGPSLY